ncbi:hypothetical protein [Alkalicoccus saliphilus]|jgi:hypothetical protein|uniref:Uncharacterized protein n=1 Tax=Alkalicoccus saliphilus TaxID=200989 RepID=A0A2T4U809_9BACI|nr:hypothetical protein [Alkalicoccus saliphilus]PTL39528.1 hypothetical protein C6Y45_05665 [Alkalicoccus saliphilus]
MNMMPVLIAAAAVCIAGLAATIMIGINPQDKDYNNTAKAKKHYTNLSLLYVVAFVPALILTVAYFIIR